MESIRVKGSMAGSFKGSSRASRVKGFRGLEVVRLVPRKSIIRSS